jgi:hypothetical protein
MRAKQPNEKSKREKEEGYVRLMELRPRDRQRLGGRSLEEKLEMIVASQKGESRRGKHLQSRSRMGPI